MSERGSGQFNLQLSKELWERVDAAMKAAGETMRTRWIRAAVEEKLESVERGIQLGLNLDDWERIQRYIDILRQAPRDSPLRVAVDQNFALYEWAAKRLPRE